MILATLFPVKAAYSWTCQQSSSEWAANTDFSWCLSLPGQVAGVTHPALLPLVEAAAGLADVQLAVQTLALGVDQELEGLETADAVALSQPGLVAQQLSLCVLFLNFCL